MENRLNMRDSQARATRSNTRPRTRNEQVSGSSPLVGSSFSGDLQDKVVTDKRASFGLAFLLQ
jgi:hypothetical protein